MAFERGRWILESSGVVSIAEALDAVVATRR
jgi:hypothetical protein